ncbi:hypothetical protein MMC31_006812, partial [Peltigera leucophlebia]|nr:hypothetical protein [Peltigera leucophlebia]
MAPIKGMKPSLTFTSTSSLSQPAAPTQWQMSLQYIRFLYFKGRLKQCAAQCKLLFQSSASPNPLHATYLHFYLALSTEGVARLTHNLSSSKMEMLIQARASYEATVSSLASVETPAETEDPTDQEAWSESETSSPRLYTPSESPSTPSPTFSTFYSPIPSSPSSLYSKNSLDDKFDDTARR